MRRRRTPPPAQPERVQVTATEADGGLTASVTITQTAVPDNAAVTSGTNPLVANSGSTSTITATVTSGATAHAPVAGDTVTWTTSGTCGSVTPTSGMTASGAGQTTTTYTAATMSGFCTTVATSPSTITADGRSTSTVTATVKLTAAPMTAINGDQVMFTLAATGTAPAAACGTLSPTTGTTNASGQVVVTYTASTTPSGAGGQCTITATEADNDTSGTGTVAQTQALNAVAFSANPTSIKGNGATTSTLTVVVTSGVDGSPIVGDSILFSFAGTPLPADCGMVSPNPATTNASSTVTATYTSAGFPATTCTITAHDLGPSAGASGSPTPSVTIIQTN